MRLEFMLLTLFFLVIAIGYFVAGGLARRSRKLAAAMRCGACPDAALFHFGTVPPQLNDGDRSRAAATSGGVPIRSAGFTVPELMTSVAVVAIIAMLSAPPLATLMLDARVKTAAFDIYTTMVYARSEAIKRNANVDILPTGGNWKNGWTVQVGGTVLKVVAPAASGLDDVTAPAVVTFGGNGRLTTPGAVTYVLGASSNAEVTTRRVIVDMSGRPSIRHGVS